jgi:ABC-2 type transport system permease protein
MIAAVIRETRFMLRDSAAIVWLALTFALSLAAVSFGIAEVREHLLY